MRSHCPAERMLRAWRCIGHARRRRTIPALVDAGYKVYAIDLLGFGESEKPGDQGFAFTTEAWRDLVLDFCSEFVSEPVTLVGNSIGSLTCILACASAKEVSFLACAAAKEGSVLAWAGVKEVSIVTVSNVNDTWSDVTS